MTKSELRQIFLQKRRNLAMDKLASESFRIASRFFESCELRAVRNLHCFIPIKKFYEIDTSFIYERIWRDFPQIVTVVPRVDLETGKIAHVVYTTETRLVENQWGIHEPANGDIINTENIDLVIVPLLCFDKRGFRVGYGKGVYDKFLSRCRPDCSKVGLSVFPPSDLIDDIGEHDIPIDICISPESAFTF